MESAMQHRLKSAATRENAEAWKAATEKFTFCLDILELSLHADGDARCSVAVDRIEVMFEQMISG
jgi:hypothetical protein